MELRIPPLPLAVLFALMIWISDRLVPGLRFDSYASNVAALAVALVGLVICSAGVAAFRAARTTVDPIHPDRTTAIVRSGIYRYTRNPMYLGFALMLLGWALWIGNWLGPVLVALYVAYLQRFQIRPEERILIGRFGDRYRSYMKSVRRWI